PTVVAVLLAVLIDPAVLAGLAVLVTIAISEFTAAPEKYATALQHLVERLAPMFRPLGFDLTHTSILDLLGSSTVAGVVGGTLTSAAAMFSFIVFVLLTMAFILNEATGFPLKLREAFGVPSATLFRINRITEEIQRYLWIKTAIAMVTALLFGGWLALLG